MKRSILKIVVSLAAGIALVGGPITARADEGMWLLPFIEKMNIEQMKQRGFRLTAQDIYNLNGTALKDAIVIFGGGCTGEIISPTGLVLTNHHCGYSTIQSHSSLEHDYLKDGFWASDLAQEIPSPGLAVTFVKEIVDVTDQILPRLEKVKHEKERAELLTKLSDKITAKYTDAATFRSARVVPMFGGNQFLLFATEQFRDVRLVGTPPSAIGKFGGDTDNWMWPRHTGDFSMFRVYSAPDGRPAEYSAENVPYKAPKHLEVSLKGYTEGDYAMILGFPGRTNRYMTSYELDQLMGQDNPVRIFVRGERQKLLWQDMIASDEVRIKYANKYAGSSNYWKNSIGMNRGLRRLDIRSKKESQQEAFTRWIAQNPEREAIYGEALPSIAKAVEGRRAPARTQQYINETLRTGVESFTLAIGAQQILDRVAANDKDTTDVAKAIRALGVAFFKNYNAATDRKVTARMLQIFADSVAEVDQPDFFAEVRSNPEGYAAALADSSIFTSADRFAIALSGKNPDMDVIRRDPAMVAAASIIATNRKLAAAIAPYTELFARGHRLWVRGLLEMSPTAAMAPDANSTLRMTYGQVLPYWAADAVMYNYFTTLDGVMAKEDASNPEFVVPQKLKELYRSKDFGPYAVDGKIPVAMLTNNDITGGNSGSGVLDADGRLIGLAFDGNWEAMSGDIAFEPDLQRTISVDIRYVLFIIDKYAGAQRLIDEMTIVR